jgi:hypothetical protein
MADSILDTVNAAYDSLETPEAAPVPAVETEGAPSATPVPEETEQQAADRVRDEAGRFAKQPKEKEPRPTLKLKTPPAPELPPGAPAVPTPQAAPPVAPEKADIPAPAAWSGIAKIRWGRIPPEAREEIVKIERERESATQELLPLKEMFDVNREFLVNQAGSVPEAMRQMMQFARMSVDNPVALAEHILRARGIDPRAAFAGQPQGPQPGTQDPQAILAQLVDQRLQPVVAQFEQQKAQAEQQQNQQLESTISQFAADPKRPFFNDVRFHMGQLIQAGAAKSLEEAYEQATWANPAIRAHLLETQREATEKANAAQVQKAKLATRASVNGSPLEGAQPPGGRAKTARDAVLQAYEDLSGA